MPPGLFPWRRSRFNKRGTQRATRPSLICTGCDTTVTVAGASPSRVAVSVIAPGGGLIRQIAMPDMFCTNICFGGPDLKTAFLTLSGTGQLVSMPWPDPGLKLAYGA